MNKPQGAVRSRFSRSYIEVEAAVIPPHPVVLRRWRARNQSTEAGSTAAMRTATTEHHHRVGGNDGGAARAGGGGAGRAGGAAREGLLAISASVGLGVLHEIMGAEVDELAGSKAATVPTTARCVTARRTAQSPWAAAVSRSSARACGRVAARCHLRPTVSRRARSADRGGAGTHAGRDLHSQVRAHR